MVESVRRDGQPTNTKCRHAAVWAQWDSFTYPALQVDNSAKYFLMQSLVEHKLFTLPHEHLGFANLVHVGLQFHAEQKLLHVHLRGQKTFRQQDAVVLYEFVKCEPHRVARLADAHRLQHARVTELHQHQSVVKVIGHFVGVGLDTAHKKWIRVTQRVHQLLERLLKLVRYGRGLFPSRARDRDGMLAGGQGRGWNCGVG